MSSRLLKQMLYGKDFSLHGPADYLHLLGERESEIKPESFNPMIPITGGMSFITDADFGMQALLFGGDWIHRCGDAGADTKHAVICLASNFDDHAGVVALSLELAMVSLKPGTDEKIRIGAETFLEIIKEVYAKNYAGIQTMASEWGLGPVKDGIVLTEKRTRSTWRGEFGYDVLIHPRTLEPCKDEDGSVLEYGGTVHDHDSDKCSFKFIRRATGHEFLSPAFLPTNTA